MTLLDLFRLIGRYWKIAVVLPLICVLACAGFLVIRGQTASYTASAYVVAGTSAQLSTLNGTASSSAREYATANPGYSASAKADTAALTVSITATGPDASGAANAANEVANDAVEGAQELLGKDNVTARVEKAANGTRASGSSLLTYLFVALLAGLFAAVCVIVAIDAIKRPVKGSADLEAASGMPVLEELPAGSGERLLADVRFASGKENVRDVVIVPVKDGAPASLAGMMLSRASQAESPEESEAHGGRVRVMACAPMLQGTSAAYQSRHADAVVLVAAQWVDTRNEVQRAANELRLAGANLVGCVLVKAPAKKGSRKKGKKGKAGKANTMGKAGNANKASAVSRSANVSRPTNMGKATTMTTMANMPNNAPKAMAGASQGQVSASRGRQR